MSYAENLHPVDHVIRAYDRYSSFYDVLFGRVLNHGRKTLSQCIRQAPGRQILEIGVGSGLMLPLYPRDAQVLGVEVCESMLQKAHRLVERHDLSHVTLQLVNAEEAVLPRAKFDHVVLPYVYSVTPDPLALMRQAFAACAPNGSVWVLNHFSHGNGWSVLEKPLQPLSAMLGFKTKFDYDTYVTAQNWNIESERKVNLFRLSRLIQIRNTPAR